MLQGSRFSSAHRLFVDPAAGPKFVTSKCRNIAGHLVWRAGSEPRRSFGENFGKPAWQAVPGEHRATLRRLIVIPGDTEPASVSSSAISADRPHATSAQPFPVNVEEGRHLWAMFYFCKKYFGRDGR